jgi:hypothetical protein
MSNFETVGEINLQTGDEIGYGFKFPIASSTTEKGAIPYGRSISSVVVTAYDSDGNDVTTEMISGTPAISGEIVSIVLTYPSVTGDGRYKLTFALTLDNGWTRQKDFQRVIAKNI